MWPQAMEIRRPRVRRVGRKEVGWSETVSSRVLGGRGRWAGCAPKRSSRDVDLLRMAEGSCTEASLRDFLLVSRTPPASATPFLDVRRLFWGPKVTFGDSHTQVRAPKIIKKYESLPLGTLPYVSYTTSCRVPCALLGRAYTPTPKLSSAVKCTARTSPAVFLLSPTRL